MVSDGCTSIHAVAVSTAVGVSPCGACRVRSYYFL